jgi:hypothetical protein
MKLDDLFELFAQELSRVDGPLIYTNLLKGHQDKPMRSYNYRFYSLPTISQFCSKLKGDISKRDRADFEFLEDWAARFVVTEQQSILISGEGKPSKKVAVHTDIAPLAIAAGNLYFTAEIKDTGKIDSEGIKITEKLYSIDAISNKTGHFQCSPASLVWPLAILLSSDIDWLAPALDIVLLTKGVNNEDIEQTLNVTKAELKTKMEQIFDQDSFLRLKDANSYDDVFHVKKEFNNPKIIYRTLKTDESPLKIRPSFPALIHNGIFSNNSSSSKKALFDHEDLNTNLNSVSKSLFHNGIFSNNSSSSKMARFEHEDLNTNLNSVTKNLFGDEDDDSVTASPIRK